MQSFHCIIARNERLAFRDSERVVRNFITQRLSHAGCGDMKFVEPQVVEQATVAALDSLPAGYILVMSIMNPMIDVDLVRAMASLLDRTEAASCTCDGAVPGTEPVKLLRARGGGGLNGPVTLRWHSQQHHNNQFNLHKYKRLKMFLGLSSFLVDMHAMSIDDFVLALERDEVFHNLVGYFTGARLVAHEACPHCRGRLTALQRCMSQPFCGYLPASRPLYHECERCGLVTASPAVHEDDIPALYDAFDTQDFAVTLNTPYRDGAPRCDFSPIAAHLPDEARTLDLGGGMGRFSLALKRAHPRWAVMHSDFAHKQADDLREAGVQTRVLNLLEDAIGLEDFDLITAWELVEHLPLHRFHALLDNVWRALAPGGFFVFSTPDFDSPLCKSLDFFAACPPFHQLVFGRSWLQRYFSESKQWEFLPPRACSDFLDDALGWYGYATRTCPTFQERATAEFLEVLFRQDGDALSRRLLSQGMGTEIIITLRKR